MQTMLQWLESVLLRLRSCEQSVEMCLHGSASAEAVAQEPANSSDSSPARALARSKHKASSRDAGQVRTRGHGSLGRRCVVCFYTRR